MTEETEMSDGSEKKENDSQAFSVVFNPPKTSNNTDDPTEARWVGAGGLYAATDVMSVFLTAEKAAKSGDDFARILRDGGTDVEPIG